MTLGGRVSLIEGPIKFRKIKLIYGFFVRPADKTANWRLFSHKEGWKCVLEFIKHKAKKMLSRNTDQRQQSTVIIIFFNIKCVYFSRFNTKEWHDITTIYTHNQLDNNGGITPIENGKGFLTPSFVRVAYSQDARQPLLGPNSSGFIEQAVFHPASRQPQ